MKLLLELLAMIGKSAESILQIVSMKKNRQLAGPMAMPPVTSDEAIKKAAEEETRKRELRRLELEVSALTEEYKTLRAEYIQHTVFQQQNLVITFAGVAGMLAATDKLWNPDKALIYVCASIVFYSLTLTHLRYTRSNVATRNYIISYISRDLRKVLERIAANGTTDDLHILGWDKKSINATYARDIMALPIDAARYLIPVIAALACTGAFWYLYKGPHTFRVSILAGEAVSFVYTMVMVWRTRSLVLQEPPDQLSTEA